MLLRYGSDVKFEIDDGVDDVDVGVDTTVVVFDVDAGADVVHRFWLLSCRAKLTGFLRSTSRRSLQGSRASRPLYHVPGATEGRW